jgi:hypothetical protein
VSEQGPSIDANPMVMTPIRVSARSRKRRAR